MSVKKHTKRIALAAALLAISQSSATAAVRTWSSMSSADFNAAANWGGTAPNATDEFSQGAVGTVDSALSASATLNGLIFTGGRNSTTTVGDGVIDPFLAIDGGAAIDLSVLGGSHIIAGNKALTADFRLAVGNNVINIASGASIKIDATVGAGTTTRFLKDGLGTVEFSADSRLTWSAGNVAPLTVRTGIVLLSVDGAKGADTNRVTVYNTDLSQRSTLQLASNLVFTDNIATPSQTFLELSGRGHIGGVDATGEGALNVVSGNRTITTTVGGGGDVQLGNNGTFGEDAARIRVASGASLTISTPIVNGATFVGANNTGAIPNLEKTGAGLLVFDTSVMSYTGATNVMDGTLRVNSSYTGAGAFTVQSGATLGGTGSIATGVTVNAGGFLAPGASIESLDVASVTGAGSLLIEYDGDEISPIDLLNVSGNLNASNLILDFNNIDGFLTALPVDGGGFGTGAYIFAKYGTLTGTFASVTDLPAGYYVNYAYNDGISSNNIAIVPEPASFVLAGLGIAGLTMLRKRRTKSAR